MLHMTLPGNEGYLYIRKSRACKYSAQAFCPFKKEKGIQNLPLISLFKDIERASRIYQNAAAPLAFRYQ